MRILPEVAGFLPVVFILVTASVCSAETGCTPPPGFKDTPHPAIAPAEQLISHTEEVVIQRSMAEVSAAMDRPLSQGILKSDSLPGVAGTHVLTEGNFGAPGSRRVVCLTDGTTVEEQSLERVTESNGSRFRYVVWNYGTPRARPVAYGVGEFHTVQIAPSETRITWTYSFKLKPDVFPGDMGALGRWLFKVTFLDRDYASLMRSTLARNKAAAEAIPPGMTDQGH